MDITWRIDDLGSVVGTAAGILRLEFEQLQKFTTEIMCVFTYESQ